MLPPAPVTFSTTTVWPRLLIMRSAMMRPMVSVGPPAEKGTTIVTGLAGNFCADAALAVRTSASAKSRMPFMAVPLSGDYTPLAADSHVAARRAVVATVLADQRVVAALGAGCAGEHRRLLLRPGRRRFQDAHLRARIAILVEDAEHRVTVHDEPREVGDGRRIGLLLAAAGHERHEVAERLGEVEQLPQLHADPRRIEHAHVEREYLAQPVERPRILPRKPDRIRPRFAVGQSD